MPYFALHRTSPRLSTRLKTLNWEKSMKEASAKGFPLINHQKHGYNLDNGNQIPSKCLVVLKIDSRNPLGHFDWVIRYVN